MGTKGRNEGSVTYQAEVNSVEYAPLTERASKAAHMGHINPKESNQYRPEHNHTEIPTSNRMT